MSIDPPGTCEGVGTAEVGIEEGTGAGDGVLGGVGVDGLGGAAGVDGLGGAAGNDPGVSGEVGSLSSPSQTSEQDFVPSLVVLK